MLNYVTLKLLVDVPEGTDLDTAITDMMAQATTPVDEEAQSPRFIIDWVVDSEAPVCDEVAALVRNENYCRDSHEAFVPMVLCGYTEKGEFAYWNSSFGPVDLDLAQRFTCPSNEDRSKTYLKNPVFLRHDQANPPPLIVRDQSVDGRLRSDDGNFDISFNAVSWLATEEWPVLFNAARANWSSAEALDEAIYRLQSIDPRVRQMLAYCEASQHGVSPCGFTCEVDGEAAMTWLKANRPEIHERVQFALDDFDDIAKANA